MVFGLKFALEGVLVLWEDGVLVGCRQVLQEVEEGGQVLNLSPDHPNGSIMGGRRRSRELPCWRTSTFPSMLRRMPLALCKNCEVRILLLHSADRKKTHRNTTARAFQARLVELLVSLSCEIGSSVVCASALDQRTLWSGCGRDERLACE